MVKGVVYLISYGSCLIIFLKTNVELILSANWKVNMSRTRDWKMIFCSMITTIISFFIFEIENIIRWITRLHLHVVVVTKNVPNVKNFSFALCFPSFQYRLARPLTMHWNLLHIHCFSKIWCDGKEMGKEKFQDLYIYFPCKINVLPSSFMVFSR